MLQTSVQFKALPKHITPGRLALSTSKRKCQAPYDPVLPRRLWRRGNILGFFLRTSVCSVRRSTVRVLKSTHDSTRVSAPTPPLGFTLTRGPPRWPPLKCLHPKKRIKRSLSFPTTGASVRSAWQPRNKASNIMPVGARADVEIYQILPAFISAATLWVLSQNDLRS